MALIDFSGLNQDDWWQWNMMVFSVMGKWEKWKNLNCKYIFFMVHYCQAGFGSGLKMKIKSSTTRTIIRQSLPAPKHLYISRHYFPTRTLNLNMLHYWKHSRNEFKLKRKSDNMPKNKIIFYCGFHFMQMVKVHNIFGLPG